MKILLTGKNGQVGFELSRSLAPLGQLRTVDKEDCDLSNEDALRRLIREYCPDIIVNPAAYTAVDKAETDSVLAESINAIAPKIMAEEAEKLGAIMVHFSTDYVFDGKKHGAYTELDLPNPQNIYGATKLAGECAVKARCSRHLILRASWVVGAHGANFAKTMLKLAAEKDELKIVFDQFGAPTSASLLADITAIMLYRLQLQDNHSELYGLYHVAAAGVTNWRDYAAYVINFARNKGQVGYLPADKILPIGTKEYPTPALRPQNSRLDTSKIQSTFGLTIPDWRDGINHVLNQIL